MNMNLRTPTQEQIRALVEKLRESTRWENPPRFALSEDEAAALLEALAAADASSASDVELKYRCELWRNHGHDGLYGDDGEMQCGKCAPVWDYKRAPLADVEAAANAARLARVKAAMDRVSGAAQGRALDGTQERKEREQLATFLYVVADGCDYNPERSMRFRRAAELLEQDATPAPDPPPQTARTDQPQERERMAAFEDAHAELKRNIRTVNVGEDGRPAFASVVDYNTAMHILIYTERRLQAALRACGCAEQGDQKWPCAKHADRSAPMSDQPKEVLEDFDALVRGLQQPGPHDQWSATAGFIRRKLIEGASAEVRCANLQAENAALRQQLEADNYTRKLEADLTALRAERDALRESLKNYGQHKPDCRCGDAHAARVHGLPPCTCGFAAALTRHREEETS